MATMTLRPSASTGEGDIGSGWSVVGSGLSEFWETLRHSDGDDNYTASDGTDEGYFVLTGFEDPSSYVVEANVESINSVQYLTVGRSGIRSRSTSDCNFFFTVPSTDPETEAYTQYYTSQNGQIETTRPDGGAWTYSDLENFQMRVEKSNAVVLRLTYVVILVDYELKNATFFGANF